MKRFYTQVAVARQEGGWQVTLDGRGIRSRDNRGRPIIDDSFLLLISTEETEVEWKLPAMDGDWVVELDTSLPLGVGDEAQVAEDVVRLIPRSVQLLRFRPADEAEGRR